MNSELPAKEIDPIQMREELQSWWEIASIAQYVSLFRFSFQLPEIEIEELEDGLIEDTTGEGSSWLRKFIVSLLRGISPARGVTEENWEFHLGRLIEKRWRKENKVNPLSERSFSKLDLRHKVDIIYSLCEYRLDRNDTVEAMKTMDADALRVQALGTDDLGNMYWYFYGTRLYKEEPVKEKKKKNWEEEWNYQKQVSLTVKRGRGRPRKYKPMKSDGESDEFEEDSKKNNGYMNVDKKSRWSVVCNTIEDWVNFAEKFQNSTSECEKSLFRIVKEDFLPTLNDIYLEKERKLQQKIRELIPHHIVTRRETRKREMKEQQAAEQQNGYTNEDIHKEHLIRERARRLEERKRRASEGLMKEERKCKRRKLNHRTGSIDSEPFPELNEYHRSHIPMMSDNNEDLKKQIGQLLSQVKLHKDAWPFLFPVTESLAPGYYDIVTDPVALNMIESKFYDGDYQTIGDIDEDFRKMVSNCQLYNGEHSELSKKGLTLWKMFRKGIAKITESQKLTKDNFDKPNYGDISEFSENPQSSIDNKKSGTELYSATIMKKKKKRIPAKAALDVLSQASEAAVKIYQSASFQSNDMLNIDKLGVRQAYSDLFPKLKVVPIHSHPQSLVDRFTSDSSNQDTGDCSNEDNSSIVNNDNNQHFVTRALDNSTADETANNYYLGNDISSELSHFIEKNSSKSFNILSENEDDMDVTSNNESTAIHENESTSSMGAINYTDPKSAPSSSEGLVHGIANILEECNNDSVSNLISNLVKEPVYSTVNTSQSKVGHNLVHGPRRSPENNVSIAVEENMANDNIPFSRENLNIQTDLTSSSSCGEMSTVDASVLGISSRKFINKQSNICNGSLSSSSVSDHQTNYVLGSKSQNSGNSCNLITHAQGSSRSNSGASEPNVRYLSSYFSEPTNSSQVHSEVLKNTEENQVVQKTASHQDLSTSANLAHSANMLVPNNASSLLQIAPAITTVATSQIPLQMPSVYSKSSNQSNNLKSGLKQFPAVKVSLPPSTGELLVVPGTPPASSTMTFHLFAQPHATQAQPIESHLKVHAINSVSPIQAEYQGSTKLTENQNKSGNKKSKKESSVYPPKKRSPVPEQLSAHSVPSQYSMPPYQPALNTRVSDASVSLNATRPSYTLSSSVPVNSYGTYNVDNSRNSVIRSSTIAASQSNGALIGSTSTSTSNAISSSPVLFASSAESFVHNSPTYQTLSPKTVFFSSYNKMARNELNAGPVMNITPGKQLDNQTQNNNSFVQNVFIPTNPQSLNMNNVIPNSSGQYVILSSPKDNTSKLYNRGQASTLQNSEASEIITSMPVLQPSNNLFQNFAFNGISLNQPQVFNQTTANQIPQYMNVPTYMIANQNFGKPPVLNIQSQVVNRRPVMMSYTGNG